MAHIAVGFADQRNGGAGLHPAGSRPVRAAYRLSGYHSPVACRRFRAARGSGHGHLSAGSRPARARTALAGVTAPKAVGLCRAARRRGAYAPSRRVSPGSGRTPPERVSRLLLLSACAEQREEVGMGPSPPDPAPALAEHHLSGRRGSYSCHIEVRRGHEPLSAGNCPGSGHAPHSRVSRLLLLSVEPSSEREGKGPSQPGFDRLGAAHRPSGSH